MEDIKLVFVQATEDYDKDLKAIAEMLSALKEVLEMLERLPD